MNDGKGRIRLTRLDVNDVISHHIHLQNINMRKWRFITCPGGMVSDLCKACKWSKMCKRHEVEAQKLIESFVKTFGDTT